MIKINKDKIIGNVIFVVEGKVTESKLLEEIFINLLKYDEVYLRAMIIQLKNLNIIL